MNYDMAVSVYLWNETVVNQPRSGLAYLRCSFRITVLGPSSEVTLAAPVSCTFTPNWRQSLMHKLISEGQLPYLIREDNALVLRFELSPAK